MQDFSKIHNHLEEHQITQSLIQKTSELHIHLSRVKIYKDYAQFQSLSISVTIHHQFDHLVLDYLDLSYENLRQKKVPMVYDTRQRSDDWRIFNRRLSHRKIQTVQPIRPQSTTENR